ncbi:queuosine precursor transporter [Trinickia mobilis]|uniref:queuosine precursor transporter n=1 Tax=Trinickia mobilis TaxID=2816356 RepID=UPI001A8D00FC|nr:queuosine precursor transporter [Trinickia mobilis]
MEQPSHQIEAVFEPTAKDEKIFVLVRVRDSGATFKVSPHDLNKKAWLEKFSMEDVAHIGFLNAATYTDGLVPLKYFPTRKRQLTQAVLALALLFVGFLMLSNVTGGRLIAINLAWHVLPGNFSVDLPAGLIVFPMTYAFSTMITEVYGFRVSRIVIWGGLAVNFMLVIGMWLLSLLPSSPVWAARNIALAQAYAVLAGEFARTFVASTVAYFAGEFLNTISLAKLKIASAGRHLWARVVFSTSIAIVIDSALFCTILFWGRLPGKVIFAIIGVQVMVKTLYELVLLPLVTTVSRRLKKMDGVDYYDYHTNFNPFSFKD